MTHPASSRRAALAIAASLSLLLPTHIWAGGADNTATGTGALHAVTSGSDNVADGFNALSKDSPRCAPGATMPSAVSTP